MQCSKCCIAVFYSVKRILALCHSKEKEVYHRLLMVSIRSFLHKYTKCKQENHVRYTKTADKNVFYINTTVFSIKLKPKR